MPQNKFDGIVLAVSHKEFLEIDYTKYLNPKGIIYDVKGFLNCEVQGKL